MGVELGFLFIIVGVEVGGDKVGPPYGPNVGQAAGEVTDKPVGASVGSLVELLVIGAALRLPLTTVGAEVKRERVGPPDGPKVGPGEG